MDTNGADDTPTLRLPDLIELTDELLVDWVVTIELIDELLGDWVVRLDPADEEVAEIMVPLEELMVVPVLEIDELVGAP